MEQHVGTLPLNARVKVTYGKKNKVDFSYPKGGATTFWRKFVKKAPYVFISYYGLLMIFCFSILTIYTIINIGTILPLFIENMNSPVITTQDSPSVIDYISLFIIGFIVPFLLTAKITLNGKWFDRNFPKIMARFVKKYYLKVEKLDNSEYILPLFKNVVLDYKATEDFGKELKSVEIIEHDIKRYIKRKGKVIKVKPQDLLWKATFVFNKIPKKGYLEIEYA